VLLQDLTLPAMQRGGSIAGTARRQIEKTTGMRVVSTKNYLTSRQRQQNAKELQNINDVMHKLLHIPKPETNPDN
jgi:hypothetical protein